MGDPQTLSGSILLVDDDPPVLAMLRAVLESEGYSVTTAVSAADAREKLASGKFEAIVTDMRMESETSGFDVVRAARARSQASAIIILTAYAMPEERWLEAGAHAGLMKPVPIVQLTALIRQLLAAREALP